MQCGQCDFTCAKASDLVKHKKEMNHWKDHKCTVCGKSFARKDNLTRHSERHKDIAQHQCSRCNKIFGRSDLLLKHMRNVHGQTGGGLKRRQEESTSGPAPKRVLLPADNPKDFYTLRQINEQRIDKFRTTKSTYIVNFKNIEVEGLPEILRTLKYIFTSLLEEVTKFAKPKDLIILTVHSSELDFPISLPVMRRQNMNVELFLSEIERVLQSFEEFVLDNTLEIGILNIENPDGGVRKRCKFVNLEKFLDDKRCIIRIENKDELCCARAIVTAKARLDEHPQWNSIRLGKFLQKSLAEDLHELSGVAIGRCGIEEVKKFQAVMPDHQIHIVSKEHFNSIIYSGPDAKNKLYLYYHDEHYDVITKMPAFLCRSYFCQSCKKRIRP